MRGKAPGKMGGRECGKVGVFRPEKKDKRSSAKGNEGMDLRENGAGQPKMTQTRRLGEGEGKNERNVRNMEVG